MNRGDSITKLTCLINGISMAGPHETIPLESCEHIAKAMHTSGWLEQVKADAWEEGFDAGERDAFDLNENPGHECIKNPYRQEQTND